MTALLSALDSIPAWARVALFVYIFGGGGFLATAYWCNRDDLAREVDEPRERIDAALNVHRYGPGTVR